MRGRRGALSRSHGHVSAVTGLLCCLDQKRDDTVLCYHPVLALPPHSQEQHEGELMQFVDVHRRTTVSNSGSSVDWQRLGGDGYGPSARHHNGLERLVILNPAADASQEVGLRDPR